jgi:hypothetical protein
MNLYLNRESSTATTISGHFYGEASLSLYAIENVQLAVPPGTYQLVPYQSPAHGPTWQLHNPDLKVWGLGPAHPTPDGFRDFCELHSANWAEQLKGCIALGLEGNPMYDPATGSVAPAVEHSVDAVAELLSTLGPLSEGHTLTINAESES